MMHLDIGLQAMESPGLLTKRTKGLGGVTQWQSQCDHGWGTELDPQL